jgi:SAM-dependent methyltransferase
MDAAAKLAIDHWDRAPLFVTEGDRYSIYPWLRDAAEFARHPHEDVLEIGCGTGCDLLQFAKHDARATGVDITPAHLRLARERVAGRAGVAAGDATSLPFPDSSFDYVYSHGVLHHIPDARAMVLEIFRVLRPNGRFNVHVYARWSYFAAWRLLQHGRSWRLWIENSRDPVHIDFYTGARLRRLFRPAKIEVRKFHCRPLPWLDRWLGFFLVAKGRKPQEDCRPRVSRSREE